jgi:hypothetical protein
MSRCKIAAVLVTAYVFVLEVAIATFAQAVV